MIRELIAQSMQVKETSIVLAILSASGVALWRLFTVGIDRLDKMDVRHNETIKELDERHRTDRTEWKSEAKYREDTMSEMLKETLKAVNPNRDAEK